MELTEPQVWTLMGVFTAMLFSSITVLVRQNDKLIASVRDQVGARFEDLDREVANLATRFWKSS